MGAKKKRSSGPTQPEARRVNAQWKLRVPASIIDRARERAAELELSTSEYVSVLVAKDHVVRMTLDDAVEHYPLSSAAIAAYAEQNPIPPSWYDEE